MTAKLILFFKKYYLIGLMLIMLTVFQALSAPPEPDDKAIPVFHTLIIESYPAVPDTEPTSETVSETSIREETEPAYREETFISEETQHSDLPEETQPETEAVTDPTEPPPSLPEKIMIEVPYYSQENWLPTGCETVSTKMLLEYYLKEEIPVETIIDLLHCEYPQEIDGRTYAPHPAKSFIGSPWDDTSFGCYAPVMVNAMNEILPEEYTAIETTGMELQELVSTYLAQGTPVLIWETMNMWETHPTVGWYLLDDDGNPTDDWYQWQANEHCMVLVGYDQEDYYFNDPLDNHGIIRYDKNLCEKRYAEQGKNSAVILETQESN